jgi:hypothetical protein
MPPRLGALLLVGFLLAISCSGGTGDSASVSTTAPAPSPSSPSIPPASSPSPPSQTATTSSSPFPGLASPFGGDLQAGDVPLTELVPAGTDPSGSWFAQTVAGDAIVVAWQAPGNDPFRTDRGFVVWRHTGDPALWRPVYAATYRAARHPVLGITAAIGDVTGDGSEDALVFAETGGSGGCGTYLVVDASTGTEAFRRSVCDTTIEPSSDPAGLVVTEAVYAHGDPHCCPSATRTTLLRHDADGGWSIVSRTTAPN